MKIGSLNTINFKKAYKTSKAISQEEAIALYGDNSCTYTPKNNQDVHYVLTGAEAKLYVSLMDLHHMRCDSIEKLNETLSRYLSELDEIFALTYRYGETIINASYAFIDNEMKIAIEKADRENSIDIDA